MGLIPELICSNIKTSLLFYTQILQFNIQYQREEERFVMLERQSSLLMLDEIKDVSEKSRSWISASLEPPFGRGINLQITTTNVDDLYHRIQKAQSPIFLPIETKWYQVGSIEISQRQFIVLDPDGYMLRFSEKLGDRKI